MNRRTQGDRRAVFSPQHYGGSDDPFETIKVLEGKLTPQEYVGFLKGNTIKYLDRHPHKDGQTDLMKSKWYHDRLLAFTAKIGHDAIYPKTMYWTEAFPEPSADLDDMIKQTCDMQSGLFMLNQSTAPYVHWVFTYIIDESLDWTIYEEESHARAAMQSFHDEETTAVKDSPMPADALAKLNAKLDEHIPPIMIEPFEPTPAFTNAHDYDVALARNDPTDRMRLADHHGVLAGRKRVPSDPDFAKHMDRADLKPGEPPIGGESPLKDKIIVVDLTHDDHRDADIAAEKGHFMHEAIDASLKGDGEQAGDLTEGTQAVLPKSGEPGFAGMIAEDLRSRIRSRKDATSPAAEDDPHVAMRRVEGGE